MPVPNELINGTCQHLLFSPKDGAQPLCPLETFADAQGRTLERA